MSAWIKLATCLRHCAIHDRPIPLNAEQNIIVINPENIIDNDDFKGICKHNHETNEWIDYIPYSEILSNRLMNNICAIAMDHDNNNLYVLCVEALIKFDLNTKQTSITQHSITTGFEASAIYLNHSLHIIGGDKSNKHLIYNLMDNKYDINHVFTEFDGGFSSHKAIYLKSKKCVLIIGGYKDSTTKGGALDTVYKYNISQNKWNKLDITVPITIYRYAFGVSMNEDFVVITCGDSMSDNIYVLDVKKMRFYESGIERLSGLNLDFFAMHLFISSNRRYNEVLISGYLRETAEIFGVMLPEDIMGMIGRWCIEEYVHIITEEGQHRKANLESVLVEC